MSAHVVSKFDVKELVLTSDAVQNEGVAETAPAAEDRQSTEDCTHYINDKTVGAFVEDSMDTGEQDSYEVEIDLDRHDEESGVSTTYYHLACSWY
jgi:hypothetical protein